MMRDSLLAKTVVPSPNCDAPRGKRSQLIVVHDVESPLTQGYADSLASNWFAKTSAQVSAHYIIGPEYAIQMVPEEQRAWHCGPAGNIISIGIEQAGYARFTRAEWTTADGLKQINVLARLIHDIGQRRGALGSVRRASNAQIKTYAQGGKLPGGVAWCTHHQITQALGGTTHTDPDPNYPYDLLQAGLDGLAGVASTPNHLEDDMAALDGDKKIQVTDYRGRFTDGESPTRSLTVEELIANGWEFTKYNAGRADQAADQIAALRKEVAALKTTPAPTAAAIAAEIIKQMGGK